MIVFKTSFAISNDLGELETIRLFLSKYIPYTYWYYISSLKPDKLSILPNFDHSKNEFIFIGRKTIKNPILHKKICECVTKYYKLNEYI